MTGRIDAASRIITAPRSVIYRALTDPEALTRWLPPDGMTGRFERFELKPGGTYRMILTYRDASGAPGKSAADADVVEGRFISMIPDECIVQAGTFESDDPAFAGTMTMTWRLEDTADGTRVTITAENVPAGISKEDHDAGLASSLANLAAEVV